MSNEPGENPVVMLVPDWRVEDDPKSSISLLYLIETIFLLHLMLIQKSPSSRLVQWSKCTDLSIVRNSAPVKVLSTAAISLEVARRSECISVHEVRKHASKGLSCFPKFDDNVFSWNHCICEQRTRAKCSSEQHQFCDTHKLLCHFFISGSSVPAIRPHVFLLPRPMSTGETAAARPFARTYTQVYI